MGRRRDGVTIGGGSANSFDTRSGWRANHGTGAARARVMDGSRGSCVEHRELRIELVELSSHYVALEERRVARGRERRRFGRLTEPTQPALDAGWSRHERFELHASAALAAFFDVVRERALQDSASTDSESDAWQACQRRARGRASSPWPCGARPGRDRTVAAARCARAVSRQRRRTPAYLT